MNESVKKFIKNEIKPSSVENANLAGPLFSKLNQRHRWIDSLWLKEVKNLLKVSEQEKPRAKSIERIISKIKKRKEY